MSTLTCRFLVRTSTKCCVPRLPDRLVRRPRLENLLADGTRRPVTLVSGPPGTGKTTLLASGLTWAPPACAAWLTLDAHDNEPGRLLALVVAALEAAGCVDRQGPNEIPADAALDRAFEQLSRRSTGCVLILDDVHELYSPAALAVLTRLVGEAPDTLDLVLSTRADPPIRLERLRLDGRLAELRYRDLCLSEDEAADFFAAHDLALTDAEARTLWERVDGWVAGLRLAARALRSEPDPSAFVSDAAATKAVVADYLLEEVLAREDDATQDFLLRTSIAERLTPELAKVLTGDARAGARLADLARRGTFLVGLDGQRAYRCHGLFRALLQAHLRHREPELVGELHRRAAAWHHAHQGDHEAEAHARAGGDWHLAGRLLLDRWLRGLTEATDPFVADPLAGLSPADVLATPELALVASVEACRWANRDEATLYRDAAQGPPAPESDDEACRTWAVARRLADATFGWAFGPDERSWAAVTELQRTDVPEAWTPRLRQVAILADAEMSIDAGHLDHGRRLLDGLAGLGEPHRHRVLAAAMLALLDAAAGDILAADERLARIGAHLDGSAAHPATAHVARLVTALCAVQRGDKRAAAAAVAATRSPIEWSSRSIRCVDRALRAAILRGTPRFVGLDASTACHPLAERGLVASGVLEVVDPAGRPIALGGDGERDVAHARRLIDTGTRNRSTPAGLESERSADDTAPHHPRTTIEGGVLAAIAAHRLGDSAAADRVLSETLAISVATDIRAPLLDHGRRLRDTLERISTAPGPCAVTALDMLDRLAFHDRGNLVEPLTTREMDVLQQLPSLMTNAEIAQRLGLSVNTVKTHLKVVYRKLGVCSRREAVLRGRDLELL